MLKSKSDEISICRNTYIDGIRAETIGEEQYFLVSSDLDKE